MQRENANAKVIKQTEDEQTTTTSRDSQERCRVSRMMGGRRSSDWSMLSFCRKAKEQDEDARHWPKSAARVKE